MKPQRSAHQAKPSRMGEEREDSTAQRPVSPRPLEPALHLGPGRLDQLVVLHTGRTGSDTGHAPEAGLALLHHRGGHRLTLEALAHEIDATSGRVHLLAP